MAKAQSATLSAEVSAKLLEWNEKQTQLADLKAQEFALRQEIILTAGFDPSKLEGTESLDIGNGWKLKAIKRQNYSLSNKNQETQNLLAAVAAVREDLAVSLVTWQPDLSTKAYKELLKFVDESGDTFVRETNAIRSALAGALTIKPGAPTLELVAPEPPKE